MSDPNDPAGKRDPSRDLALTRPAPEADPRGQPPPHGAPIVAQPPQQYPPQPYPQPQQYPPQPYPQPPYPPQGYAPPGYPPPQHAQGQAPQGYPPYPYGQAMVLPNIQIVVQGHQPGGLAYPQGLVRVGNRTRVAAAVLAFLFGAFGMHKFYLGRPVAGVLYLLFFWTFIPYLLGLIDFILLLVMSDHEFDLKYNTALQLPQLPR